jgi:hypothetical protein
VVHAHFLAAPHGHEHIMAGVLRAHNIARSATKARTSAVIVQIWRITLALIAAPVRLHTGSLAYISRMDLPCAACSIAPKVCALGPRRGERREVQPMHSLVGRG